MKIGIFGGTFNPVHNEHVEIAIHAQRELNLDKLIIMPDYMPPHKEGKVASASDREAMLRLAFSKHEGIEISRYEIKNSEKSYTYITAEHLREEFPNDELYFIVGEDMLLSFSEWKNPERILSCVKLAVFRRGESDTDFNKEQAKFKALFNSEFKLLKYQGKDLSSTLIRLYAELGVDLQGLVSDEVLEYIIDNNVYAGDGYTEFLKRVLSEKRLRHTANVVETALQKSKELGLDTEKVRLAALLHDCAKNMRKEDYPDFNCPEDLPLPVQHAFLGEYVARELLGVNDEEILDAIKYHTSGKPKMSLLGKLIFVADMVERDRVYEGVEYLRECYKKMDIREAFKECLKEEVVHLINKKVYIYKETLNAYDYYIKKSEV